MNKFTYNMFHEIQRPTVILSSVHHKHYGVLENIDYNSFSCNFNMNSAQEISFDVYKYLDEHKCSLWEKLTSFKYLYVPDHHEYYKIDVTLDQDDKTVKHITGTSAGEYELSQRKIQAMDINTENDLTYYEQKKPDGTYEKIATPDNTEPTVFYNPDDPHKSILHRAIADRAPDWSIGHVDESIMAKKRVCTFSVSNQTIYDFLTNTIATEFDVLFKFDSVNRVINAYDLLNMCENPDCLERGDFTDVCPKCGGTNIHRGYGHDSHIYISANNYASKITVDGDEGSVKNCFRLIGGDDVMTATVKNCNPSGSEYIYQFSEADYDDMPEELVDKLEDYAELYAEFEAGKSTDGSFVSRQIPIGAPVNCGFKPNYVTVQIDGKTVKYKYGELINGDTEHNNDIKITDYGFIFYTNNQGQNCTYTAAQRKYSDLTTDYYNALTEYYYYKTSMMPRTCPETVDASGKVDHWQPNTNYNLGQVCYVITLPSYCYLKCITQGGGTSGDVEFDATNVIPSDDPLETVTIQDGTITWEVVRNNFTMPTAQQTLDNIIKPYIENADTIVYFEDSFPAGLSANPQTFTTVNKYVKDLLTTVVNPLFKIEILNSGSNVSTWSSGWSTGDTNTKHGRLNFYIKITNTTDSKDTAQVVYDQARLTIKCAIADSVKQHQEYMKELVEKRIDKKDENFTSVYQTEKRDNSSYQLTGGATEKLIELGYVPQYVVVEYTTTVDNETIHKTLTLDYGQFWVTDGNNEIMLYSDPNVDPSHYGFWFTSQYADVLFYYTAVSDELFETTIKQYSLDLLSGFLNSYSDCRDVLIANNITANEPGARDFHGVDLYSTMYAPYNHKVKLLETEVAKREQTVKYYDNDPEQKDDGNDIPVGGELPYDPSLPNGLIQRVWAEMAAIQDALDLKEFLKDDTATDPYWMWYTLFNYIREGEYQNSNYISDGLANNTLVQYAQELLDKGTKELAKATELQYSLSDDLGNLLNTEEFAPFKDKFELGDYIICGVGDNKDNLDVDDHNYKLRLISLSYSYGNPESVSVTFANVTKIKNYFSDTQDILAQAKSMGSSYSAVTHQVDKNTDTTATVNSWNQNGLNSSLTKIMNNTREEVIYDNSGIILKEYDYTYDESKDNRVYSDDQLRITHDILAFTEDNWKTATLGLGRQSYKYYDEHGHYQEDGTGYGLIAKFVDSGFIRGSQFIAGEIYSDDRYDDNGVEKPISHMDFNKGTFELAEGRLKFYYDSQDQPQLYIDAGTELHGDLKVYDSDNYLLFEADTSNSSVQIGGWSVDRTKIYAGDASSRVAVMQKPNPNMVYVFAAGGTSHSSYADCPFRVTKTGELYSTKTIVDTSNGLTSELSPGKLSLYGSLSQNVRYSFKFDSSDGQILTIGKENYSSGEYQYNTPYFVIKNDGKIYANDIYLGSADPTTGGQKSVYSYMAYHTISGSKGITVTATTPHWLVLTNSEINGLLGVSNSDKTNTVVYICNGDRNAQTQNVIATYYYDNGSTPGWYAELSGNPGAGNYRFSYIISYFG